MSNISYARGNPGPKSQVNKKAHQKRTKGIEDCWELSSGRSHKIKRHFVNKQVKFIIGSVQNREIINRWGVS